MVGPDPCGSNHFPVILENDGPSSLERIQSGRWRRISVSIQHSSAPFMNDADDSTLKDIA